MLVPWYRRHEALNAQSRVFGACGRDLRGRHGRRVTTQHPVLTSTPQRLQYNMPTLIYANLCANVI